jgi:undecaprenyl diphosphate synthase
MNLKHLAIIMDGNGRWAKMHRHNRFFGHVRGARVAKSVIERCVELKIPYLTLFAFSTENWFRPAQEIRFLMNLLVRHLRRERANLIKNNIRFQCVGDLSKVPFEVQKVVLESMELTKNNTGLNLVFALSFGGRQEITTAVKNICEKVQSGLLRPEDIDEATVGAHLESAFLPSPDLIIRTSGEQRISNFFLWEAAYSELYFCPKMWPDFTMLDLDSAFQHFWERERRFGRVNAPPSTEENLLQV